MTMRWLLTIILFAYLPLHASDWEYLFDQKLSKFEIWMGVPHTTVEGLPEGTPQLDDYNKGTPMGLDADVKGVFKMTEVGGELQLRISGEIYGGLTTLNEYENYHLSVQVKWGEKKWEPRLKALRDSGILYHCHGKHGSFWNVWKSSLEYQVQETDMGDFIQLAGARAKVRSSKVQGKKRPRFDPASKNYSSGFTSAWPEPDVPHGEWNQLDLYVVGNEAVHMVNGQVVLVVEDAVKKDGTPLTKGQIQIQSEAAEVYYRDLRIRSIESFPYEFLNRLLDKPDQIVNKPIPLDETDQDSSVIQKIDPKNVVIAINCGGPAYTSSRGIDYQKDAHYKGGGVDAFPGNTVKGTTDDLLYNYGRAKNRTFTGYSIPVPDGEYQVVLQFAETAFTADNKRVFDLSVEGELVLDDLDLHATAPGQWVAYDRLFKTTVTDAVLDIEISASVNNPLINGIIVLAE